MSITRLEALDRALQLQSVDTGNVFDIAGQIHAWLNGAEEVPKTRKTRGAATVEPVAETAAAAQEASPPAVEPDPFATGLPAAVVVVTIEQVRDAAVELSKFTSQASAVAVLKAATGAGSLAELTPDKYATALLALQTATPKAPVAEVDPFATGTTATAPATAAAATTQTDTPNHADLKAAVVAAQKKTGDDLVMKIVMDNGGVAVGGNGQKGASLKSMPLASIPVAIAALKALPKTK